MNRLTNGLGLSQEQRSAIETDAAKALEQQPNLWQVLYSVFGHQFNWPGQG